MSMWLYIRKGYGSQHCLQMMLETWKKATNNKKKRLEHCWQIYLKHLFAGVMIYWFLTFMQMVSTYFPVSNCIGIKVFGQISPPISLYHFPLLQEFDLKKPSSSFEDLEKFLKPTLAISFLLTVRHGKVAFEHVTIR